MTDKPDQPTAPQNAAKTDKQPETPQPVETSKPESHVLPASATEKVPEKSVAEPQPAPTVTPASPPPQASDAAPAPPIQTSDEKKPEPLATRDLNDPRFKDLVQPTPSIARPEPAKDDTRPPKSFPAQKVTERIPELDKITSSSEPSTGPVCPTCGHRNRPGVLLCENCGTNLMTGKQTTVGTRDLREQEAEKAAEDSLLDTEQRKAVEMAGGSVFNEEMVLRVEIEGGSTPMLVYPKQEIIIGRRDPNTGGMPDVDLTAYAGYRMGVSRRHAAIRLQEKHLNLSDLGSSNGTFLNGTRLSAHRPYQLRDGDEVRLGQMVLRLFFQSSKERP